MEGGTQIDLLFSYRSTMNIELIEGESQWIERSKEFVFESLALIQHPKSIVIPGGSTPIQLFKELGSLSLPWQEASVYQSDERLTDDITELNLTTQLNTLTKEFVLQLKQFVIFNTEKNREDMVMSYSSLLPTSPFDLVILGMGDDGHVASLFDLEDIKKPGDVVFTAAPATYITSARVSLGWGRISKARKILLLSKGAKKLDRIYHSTNTPLEHVLSLDTTHVIHCVDNSVL